MPETRPDNLPLDELGRCNACVNYARRNSIDWDQRRRELGDILEKYSSRDGSNWDCIIPVSGGKDSTYQVLTVLQLGFKPLCVTATTCDLSDIGRKNIENIKSLGVDYLEFSMNPIIRKKLNRIGLTHVGDISWPEHVAIFTMPMRVAVQFNIPLIIWGENAQHEYGGPHNAAQKNILDRRWLEEFGGLLGLRVSDVVGLEGIEQRDLVPCMYPSDEDLARVGVHGLYLGHYIPWDGLHNALIAQAYGFTTYEKIVEGSMANYENVDNHQTGIHDYFKFLKYGFGRATDIASLHVRRGRLTREQAVDLVTKHDGKFPWTYLGKSLEQILSKIDMSVDEFMKICDQFTNKKIFEVDERGNLKKDKQGNLIKRYCPINNQYLPRKLIDEGLSCRL